MRVHILRGSETTYSCNSYLLLGDQNDSEDINTLIDTGMDESILRALESLPTGIGKKPVQQIILTHNHYDHIGGVEHLKRAFQAKVYAFAPHPLVDELLHDGQYLRAGDDFLKVFHTPGHSDDSVCLYQPLLGILFSGDTQYDIKTAGGVYHAHFIETLSKLLSINITTIYPGHNFPVLANAHLILENTYRNVQLSPIVS